MFNSKYLCQDTQVFFSSATSYDYKKRVHSSVINYLSNIHQWRPTDRPTNYAQRLRDFFEGVGFTDPDDVLRRYMSRINETDCRAVLNNNLPKNCHMPAGALDNWMEAMRSGINIGNKD